MRRQLASLAVTLAALSFVACGGGEPKSKAKASGGSGTPATQAPAGPAAASGAATGGASSGSGSSSEPTASDSSDSSDAKADGPRVTFSGSGGRAHWVGSVPPAKQLNIDPKTAEACHDHAPVDPIDRSVLVGEDRGLQNVVIEIEVEGAAAPSLDGPFAMDQQGCRFEPHVLLVPAGATVEYHNSDAVGHNVHTYAKRNESMNKTIAAGGKETQTYEKADQIEVKCDIHPWMGAWVVVSDASVLALAGADGGISLPPLPPGKHKLNCWHESLGTASGTLEVAADGTLSPLELELGSRSGRRPR